MGMIDIGVIAILVISGLCATYRGLVRELLGLAAWGLAAVVALFCLPILNPFMAEYISNPMLCKITTVGVVALIVLVVCTLINAHIAQKLRSSALSGLDRILGFAFGLLRGVVFVVSIYFCAAFIVSSEKMEQYKNENKTMPYVEKCKDIIYTVLPTSLQKTLTELSEENDDTSETLQDAIEFAEKAPIYLKEEQEDLNDLILELVEE